MPVFKSCEFANKRQNDLAEKNIDDYIEYEYENIELPQSVKAQLRLIERVRNKHGEHQYRKQRHDIINNYIISITN